MIVPIESDNDSGVLTAEALDTTTIALEEWSPNHLTATVEATEATSILLNANYAKGWQVNGQPADEAVSRVVTPVPAGHSTLHFSYHPPGFRVGLIISIITLLGTAFFFDFRRRS